LHAGATVAEVNGTLDAIEDLLDADGMRGVRFLWARVRGK
jgi:hypothetical protein